MKKFSKFLKSFLFISFWLILSSFLTQYWNTFHWKYIYLNLRIFDKEFWFVVEKILFGFDIRNFLKESLNFLSYEIPKDSFKYFPIYFVLKSIWIKN
ncbi:putative Virion host shutoff protein [Prochlorococcus marinus str. MIT 9302]|uniref:Putative Virion host shutoff protein n=1 Tax=Prochlorococcus marinus str. MIT 9302 TaxID=74545 RepID=A0A0A2ABX9_PROMR|nr:putative Virion host shutoff protein [Prochlorococcus marinus str. MIT 9302]